MSRLTMALPERHFAAAEVANPTDAMADFMMEAILYREIRLAIHAFVPDLTLGRQELLYTVQCSNPG